MFTKYQVYSHPQKQKIIKEAAQKPQKNKKVAAKSKNLEKQMQLPGICT
jgi:hypothetical protein